MESSLLEKLIIKCCYIDNHYLSLVSATFKSEYFEDSVLGTMFETIQDHYKHFGNIIPKDILVEDKEERSFAFKEIDSIDFDVKSNYQFLYDETEKYLKEKAVKTAILESVDIVQSGQNTLKIYQLLEDSLTKSLSVSIGLDYFGTLADRLKRIFNSDIPRIPTYFPQLDEYFNGGFPPCTFSVFVGRVGGGKSQFMTNVSARQVLNGHNVVVATLEMSEDMYAQRYDAVYSGLNINRIYVDPRSKSEMIKSLSEIKNPGKLYIRQFPTGRASTNDFRIYLKELQLHKVKADIFYCDYMNLMKPSYRNKTDMYSDVKDISEELRGLSFEFNMPVISVSQLNRPGTDDVDLTALDIVHISESMGTAATADDITIFGISEEHRLYKNEMHYKIIKNRLGGRVGEIGKFYHDAASLKIYDIQELDTWRSDSIRSGDSRNIVERSVKLPKGLGSKSRRKVEDED